MKILLLSFLAWPLSAEPGQQLAQFMRQSQLLGKSTLQGDLQTKQRRGQRITQTIQIHHGADGNQTHSTFTVFKPNKSIVRLTIIHNPQQTPRYYLSDTPNQLGRSLSLPQEAMSSFAGSDFWPADLGLEFFHWHQQKILPNIRIKMRKGIACQVLESRQQPASNFGYNRVRSWISREHFGLVYAEAYNADGRRVKTFEVSGLQKINGQWKVKELRIRNEITKSTTKLIINNHESK